MIIRQIILIGLTVIVSLGCEPDHGTHSIYEIGEQENNTEILYINYLKELIRTEPGTVNTYLKLAGIYKNTSKHEEAIRMLRNGLKQTGDNVEILAELGKIYLESGQTEQLSGTLKLLRSQDPDNINFLKLSSGYALLLGDTENASFFANRALIINPLDDDIHYLLGETRLKQKDSLTALNIFMDAYNLLNSQRNFRALFGLALNLRQYQLSRSLLEKYEKNDKDKFECLYWGMWYNATADNDSARSALSGCDFGSGKADEVYYEFAKSYYPKQSDSVLYYVDQSLSFNSRNVNSLILKARTLDRLGNFDRSRDVYQEVLRLDSASAIAQVELSNLERKVAYLRLVKKKESGQKDLENLRPLNSRTIN